MRKGEIEGRFDPNFISISKVLEEKFKASPFKYSHFGKCIDYIQYGISALANTVQKGIPIIRMNNLKEEQWNFSDIKHIEISKNELDKYQVLDGDLLFNRTNSKELVGKCGVFRERGDWVFASYLIRVRVNRNLLLPDYAAFFLSSTIGRLQIDCLSRQIIGMTNINAEEIKLIKIPIPPLETQTEIVALFEAAYASKKQKEAGAATLLASINGYLLTELGITLPPPSERKNFFYINARKVSGRRLDPFYHQSEFEENNEVINKGSYKAIQLKQVVQKLVKGKLPKDNEKNGQLKVVQINSINSDGHIDTSNLLTAKEIFTSEQRMQKNDVLVVITGATIGKIAMWEQEEKEGYFLGGDIVKFQCFEDVNPHFVFAWLRCQSSQIEIKRNVTGATNGHLSPSDINNILIPLPPLEKQTEIADHISALRTQAKQLQQQAQAELAQVKIQVERMILGEH